MSFFLQFGFGMMELSRELADLWKGGNVILSPCDLNEKQIISLGTELKSKNIEVFIEPQYYFPESDRITLISQQYWPKYHSNSVISQNEINSMTRSLINLNINANTQHIIIPGRRAEEISSQWIDLQNSFYNSARDLTEKPLLITLCISSEIIMDNMQVENIVNSVKTDQVYGYFLAIDHPKDQYFVEDPNYIFNLLDFGISLQKLGKKVIYGYSNPQNLIMECGGIFGLSSGNWNNTRYFQASRFFINKGGSNPAKWFYCPQVFSEYKLNDLSLAFSFSGIRSLLTPNPDTNFSKILFNSPDPISSSWDCGLSFRHYLCALRKQMTFLESDSFEECLSKYHSLLDEAENTLKILHAKDLTGLYRDFYNVLQTNRLVMQKLEQIHGPYLKREWKNIRNL